MAGGNAGFSRRWLAAVLGCTAMGLGCVESADAASRSGRSYSAAVAIFWLGLVVIFVPVAVRVLTREVSRRERLSLVVLLGVALYGVKILGSPSAFTFADEYIHLRNTEDILRTGHLFGLNPLLPTAAYYPGLAAATAGLVDLTGLSTFVAGLLIIGAARVLICVCLFLVAERVTRSSLAAAAASLVYTANPLFLFWSSSFSYEDLALPLAAFVVWWLGRTREQAGRLVPTATVAVIAAVIVTHHVSAFALMGLLAAWWLAERLAGSAAAEPPGAAARPVAGTGVGWPAGGRHSIGLMALAVGAGAAAWFHFVARPAGSYLWASNIFPALKQLGSVLTGHTALRQPYSGGGAVPPAWYVLAGFAAVALLLLALPPALHRAVAAGFLPRRSGHAGRQGGHAPAVVAVAVAVVFPLTLVPRLTAGGGAVSARTSEYVFTGLGCVLGLLAGEAIRPRRGKSQRQGSLATLAGRRRALAAAAVVTAIFVGEVTVGTPYGQLLPESSRPRGYPRMVQPDVVSAAEWARGHLGINRRFGVDVIDAQALAVYGEQDTVPEISVWPVFFPETMNDTVVHTIRALKVRYVFVDWRMTRSRPSTPGSYYFSPYEPHTGGYGGPFPGASLRKFASTACAHLVYQSGPLQIFDVRLIENGSCVPAVARGPGGAAAGDVVVSP